MPLVLIVVFQAFSLAVWSAKGREHTHRERVLVDFRRGPGHSTVADDITAWRGHHHGLALRHHHAAGDPDVFFTATDLVADQASEDGAFAPQLNIAVFIAMASTGSIAFVDGLSHRRAMHRGWQPTTGSQTRLERPPQPA